MRIQIDNLRKLLTLLLDEHRQNSGDPVGDCFVCSHAKTVLNELDAHKGGFLVLEGHGKETNQKEADSKRKEGQVEEEQFKKLLETGKLRRAKSQIEATIDRGRRPEYRP